MSTASIFSTIGNHRSTFLPQVWEQLPEPASSWPHQLKRKAGLPADTFWAAERSNSRATRFANGKNLTSRASG
jgi:hypothetical protein